MGQAFSGVKRSSYLLLAGAFLALLPSIAGAVGLGPLKVKSALNEPLNAEIPLTSVTRREIRSLEASLAPRGAFEALGIERPHHLTEIKFNVAKRLDGTYFLQLTTRKPYQEPFLHMLVQVEWAGGRLRREYTALIDPPYLSSARPSSITAPRLQTPAEDYEPLPAPLSDEVLKESTPPAEKAQPEKLPEPAETLPAPLPEEPALINKEGGKAEADTPPMDAAVAETAPALPEPIQSEPSADKSIDQIEAEAFGAGKNDTVVASEPAMPEPMAEQEKPADEVTSSDTFDRSQEDILGPPHIPVIAVEPAPGIEREPAMPMADRQFRTDQYKVKRGDTLYEIAVRLRADSGVTLNQLMMAIYEANPRAFYGNNVNNLRSGRILQIPEIETVQNRSAAADTRKFRAQYDAWQEHKLQMAQAAAPVKVASEPTPKSKPVKVAEAPKADDRASKIKAQREAEEKMKAEAKAKADAAAKAKADAAAKAKAEAKAKSEAAKKPEPAKQQAPAKPTPSKTAKAKQTEDLLRIVRASMLVAPSDGAKVAETESRQAEKERQMLAKRMDNIEESADSAKLRNKEIGDKVGKLQKNVENQKRLIEVENPSLAKTQPATTPEAKTDKPVAKPAAKQPAKVAKTPKPIKRPPPPPPVETSILDSVLDALLGNQFMLMLLGGVVLLGLAIFAIYMKRRRKTLADFEESILSADTTTDDLSTDSQDALGESGDTSFLSDFSQEGMGNIATDEVDPIAEADVYLAYGRDEQAEEILKDAISKHPERAEVKLKLLEIYHQRNDVSAFETLAEEVYASGNAGAVWSQVADMGGQLNPDNPMFKGDAPPPGMMGGGGGVPAAGGDLDMTEMVPGEAMMDDGSGLDDSLDFDIDTPMSSGGAATELVSPPSGGDDFSMDLDVGSSADDSSSLDFNLDTDVGGGEAAPAEEASAEEEGDFALDFNMDTADFSTDEDAGGEPAAASTGGDSGLDFSMDFEDMAGDSGDTGSVETGEGLSMGDDSGLSFDMDSEDSSMSLESGEDDSLSFDMEEEGGLDMGDDSLSFDMEEEGGLDMGDDSLSMESSDDALDFSSMESEDDGMSALDMVKASGGGLPENEDGSLDFSLSGGSGHDNDYGMGDDDDLNLTTEFGGGSDVAEAVDISEAIGTAEADVDSDENWDEAATKLDLAKAYIDMGDAEGAKSILDEVMAEGNEDQKAQASELAAQI